MNRERIDYVIVEELAALVWLANLAALELHVPQWQVTGAAKSDEPQTDLIVFDLDPGPPATIEQCCEVALALRDVLVADGLTPLPKTSGSKGMQVSAPVVVDDPQRTSDYAHDVAERLERALPEAGRLADEQVAARRQGLRRLEPEQPGQDHGRARTRCGPGRTRRCRPR